MSDLPVLRVEKIISGGQIGADIAALRAGRALGLETGGWCPKGWRTRNGMNLELRDFGLHCTKSVEYPTRTLANVRDGDATLRFAHNFDSPGERMTLKAIRRLEKPYLDILIQRTRGMWHIEIPTIVAREFLQEAEVEVLNVAGNADPSIEAIVEKFIKVMLGGRR